MIPAQSRGAAWASVKPPGSRQAKASGTSASVAQPAGNGHGGPPVVLPLQVAEQAGRLSPEEGLDLVPCDLNEKIGHGFRFRVVEEGEAAEQVVRVNAHTAVFFSEALERVLQGCNPACMGVEIDEILSGAASGEGRKLHCGDILGVSQRQ